MESVSEENSKEANEDLKVTFVSKFQRNKPEIPTGQYKLSVDSDFSYSLEELHELAVAAIESEEKLR
jgi:hypothetical protein